MIDISEIAKGNEKEYLRHLSELCSCPCYLCVAVCEKTCLRYQLWADMMWKERELHERRNHKGSE